MLKQITAVALIFLCASVAWLILAASISFRTNNSAEKLKPGVASTWGAPQQQIQPTATLEDPVNPKPNPTSIDINSERSRVRANLTLEYRQKGLLWYSLYVVRFSAAYSFRNTADQPRHIVLNFYFPARQALYDDLSISADGRPLPFSANQNGAAPGILVPAGKAVEFEVTYQSRGLDSWQYSLGQEISQTRDFELTLVTNFKDIDFPSNTLSPTGKVETSRGWNLTWRYRNLISGFAIGMAMPQKLQPGPLAGQISAFAPVSLLLYFFVLMVLTTIRKVELHPVNYFFLAASFFAFHLLFAYSVDHISIQLAFVLSSLVSVALVVSYLRIVVGRRIAVVEAGLAQFVYLVLFSFSFFLQSFTGLAITIGCIATLFITMQVTARVQWPKQLTATPDPA